MVTMITTTQGHRGTQNILQVRRVLDISDTIYLLEPEAAPLYVFVSKLNKASSVNTTFQWIEDELNPSWDTTSTSETSATETVDVDHGTYFNKYDLVKVPRTGEVMLVTAIDTNDLTVVRGYGETGCADTAANEPIVIIGSAFQEGSANTELVTKSTRTERQYNYAQIFRKSVEITESLANSELYGGNDRDYQRKKKGIELMRDFERSFLYGDRFEDTGSKDTGVVHARRITGGALFFITTNATDAGGTFTESEFETFLRSVFRYGSKSRYLFCSPLVNSVISQWAIGKLQMVPKDKTYGIAITQYLSPHGTVNLVNDVMLEGATYGGYALAIELEELRYRYLQNRDTKMKTDIQHPGDDFLKDAYLAEIGLEFRQERKHGYVYGVSG